MKTITAKIGKMRKAVSWVVYPGTGDDITIQCDKRICRFNKNTGKGVLSASHNYPTFITLALPGCENVTVPQDVIDAATAIQPQGDTVRVL